MRVLEVTTRERVTEEMFTFTPLVGDTITLFSGRLREAILATGVPAHTVEFPAQTLEEAIANHGVEVARLQSMTEKEASEPVIIGIDEDETHILIDGAHRRAFWLKRGVNQLKAWVVPHAMWKEYIYTEAEHPFALHDLSGEMLPQRLAARLQRS